MDAKITKERLGRLLSYDWIKIVALMLGIILFWSLLFSTTATRITTAQEFSVWNHYANGTFSSKFSDFYGNSIKNKVYSHEVLEVVTNDLVAAGDTYMDVLQGNLSIQQADVMFVPNIGDENYKTTAEDSSVSYTYSYIESFMVNYGHTIYELNAYFAECESFLKGYYSDYTNAETLNTEKVEADFRARIKANKDKRYKKEEQIIAGVKGDLERVEKYRAAYLRFQEYLQAGVVSFTHVTVKNPETDEVWLEGNYAINLCTDESKTGELKKYAYYRVRGENDVLVPTAKDMNAMIFNFTNGKDGYQFESLLFLDKLLSVCLTK